MKPASILIVDDDQRMRETLEILVRQLGYTPLVAENVAEAQRILTDTDVDLVISDLRMPGGTGLDLLQSLRSAGDDVPFIVLTAFGTVESAVEAMQRGAIDYVLKPFDAAEVELRIARALEQRRYRVEHDYLREELETHDGGGEMIGASSACQALREIVRRVAPSDASVLIRGETGTGKELVARLIHKLSHRRDRLMVPINLSAVPEDLLESELFGHVRGAFTGAVTHREGKFELAHEGTLFLDEIGDVPMRVQPKLLRALQDGVVERVGSNKSRTVNVRIVSATNRELQAAVEAGEFRADLYYRLRVVEIEMPPLRARRDDIRYLVAHFLRKYGQGRARGVPQITEAALRLLEEHDWPGNVRELENAVERAVVLCTTDVIAASMFDFGRDHAPDPENAPVPRLDEALDRLERQTILRALDETANVKARAAKLLGVSERTLWYKLRKHGIS